jgi:hypothetical protein
MLPQNHCRLAFCSINPFYDSAHISGKADDCCSMSLCFSIFCQLEWLGAILKLFVLLFQKVGNKFINALWASMFTFSKHSFQLRKQSTISSLFVRRAWNLDSAANFAYHSSLHMWIHTCKMIACLLLMSEHHLHGVVISLYSVHQTGNHLIS